MEAITGAEFSSSTMIVKRWVALRLGVPLSKTRMRTLLLLGPCASEGVQVKRPLVGLRTTPAGAETISYVRIFVGTSASVALFVRVMVLSSEMVRVRLLRLVRTGARLTS